MKKIELIIFSFICLVICLMAGPSFLATIRQPPTPEGERIVGVINKIQQGYYIENKKFYNSFQDLNKYSSVTDLIKEKYTYNYLVRSTDKSTFNYAVSQNVGRWPNYVGAVFVVPAIDVDRQAKPNELNTIAIICAGYLGAIDNKIAEPTYTNKVASCGLKTKKLGELIKPVR